MFSTSNHMNVSV